MKNGQSDKENEMSFDEIMKEITSGLTGDIQKDVEYIEEQSEKYKDHEMSKEILRACGRLLYDILPEEKRKELAEAMEKDELGTKATLDEVRFNIYKGEYEKAYQLMKPLADKADELISSGMFQNDRVSEYYTFASPFEEILYGFRHETKKTIRKADIPFAEIFLQFGSLLIDMKKYEEAKQAMAKAVRWNPANAQIAFEYAETYKLSGDIEGFFRITRDTFGYAVTPENLARCYRNLAYYFVEKKQWKEATGCNLLSLQYQKENSNAMSELYYIQQMAGKDFAEPTMEEMEECGKKYGFPLGPDGDVLGLAFAYGKHFAEEGNKEAASYFFGIVYGLTGDEELKNIIDSLR